jgi:inosine/xanthosine triphosphate pyrophosphatase family protein
MTSCLLLATRNDGKKKEFESLLNGNTNWNRILSLTDFEKSNSVSFQEAEENFDHFCLNAIDKLHATAKSLNQNAFNNSEFFPNHVLADDSGLCIPKLGFAPGVHSAKLAGLPRSDANNSLKLREVLKTELKLKDTERVEGFFVSFLVLADANAIRALSQYDTVCNAVAEFKHNLIAWEKERFESLVLGAKSISANLPCFNLKVSIGICNGFVGTIETDYGFGHGYDSIFYTNTQNNESFATLSVAEKNKRSHRALAVTSLMQGF